MDGTMPQRYLDDFMPGEVFKSVPQILSDKHFAAFAAMTGDAHPLHYDADYARAKAGMRRLRTGFYFSDYARSVRRRSARSSPSP
jgi:3-hydroxybutyryl-CoA dehydratase